MKSSYQIGLILLLSFGLLIGCVSNPLAMDLPTSTHNVGETSLSISPTLTPPPIIHQAEKIIQLAVSDLVKEFYISEDEIRLLSIESVEWTDTSLGCPQPGVTYTQEVTRGYQIHLVVKDETYIFHTDEELQIVLCDNALSAGKAMGEKDPTVKDGDPNQPIHGGSIDKSKVTPLPWLP